MKLSDVLRGSAVFAASFMLASANAQWASPSRYNHQDLHDRAEAVAVDIRGNIFVAGTVDTTGNGGNLPGDLFGR